ncbi:Uma2 family endonuclease [Desulfobacterales bacterium HSG17]|nr:Uma2 family endonuclease [Desulfobacterales bacterium HSG17]
MVQVQHKDISSLEYFEMEKSVEYKSEYYHGEIFAMTGASVNHNLINANIIVAIGSQLKEPCLVFPSDIKVEIDPAHHYVYPDVSVVCGDIEYGAGRNDIITNPKIIIEILSESIGYHDRGNYDRGDKFLAYRGLSSLTDYILVNQYSVMVEHFIMKKPDLWEMRVYRNLNDMLNIDSIDVSIAVKDIYKNVGIIKNLDKYNGG